MINKRWWRQERLRGRVWEKIRKKEEEHRMEEYRRGNINVRRTGEGKSDVR